MNISVHFILYSLHIIFKYVYTQNHDNLRSRTRFNFSLKFDNQDELSWWSNIMHLGFETLLIVLVDRDGIVRAIVSLSKGKIKFLDVTKTCFEIVLNIFIYFWVRMIKNDLLNVYFK